jgi:hypothetical protein
MSVHDRNPTTRQEYATEPSTTPQRAPTGIGVKAPPAADAVGLRPSLDPDPFSARQQ